MSLVNPLLCSTRSNLWGLIRLAGVLLPNQMRTLQSSLLEIACPQVTVTRDATIHVLLPMWHPLEVILSIGPSIL